MNWVTAFTIWLGTQGIPVDGVSGQGASAVIWYKSSATSQQISTAEAAKSTFTVPPQPDLNDFMAALIADTTIPNAAHVSLAAYVGILQALIGNPSALQLEWSRLTSTDTNLQANCNDSTGQTVAQRVQQYASTYYVPLVSQ